MNFTQKAVCTAVLASAAATFSNPLAAQDFRIIGGAPITLDGAPSIVAILFADTFANTGSAFQAQFCAGTLISESYVLTAGHCVVFNDVLQEPDSMRVLADTFDLNNPGGEPLEIAEVIVHENYVSSSNSYDIALIRLAEPVDFPTAQLIDPNAVLEINESVAIAGWGTRQFDPTFGSFDPAISLEGAFVNALPGDICNTLESMVGTVDETMVCAGFPDGGVDACQGDSGGPLYRQGANGEFILAGITSWGIGCALAGNPGVYSNVAFFNDWITERAVDAVTTGEEQPVEIAQPEPEPPVEIAQPEPEPEPPVEIAQPEPEPEPPVEIAQPEPPAEVPVTVATNDEDETAVDDVPETPAPVTVATNEEGQVTGVEIPALGINTSSGGGSAGGLFLGALAFIGAMRRRSVKS